MVTRALIEAAAARSGTSIREVERTLACLSQDPVLRERIVSALAALGVDRRHLDRVSAAERGGFPHTQPRADGKARK